VATLAGAAGLLVVLAVVDLVRVKIEIDRGRDRLDQLDLEVAATDGGIERLIGAASHHLARADHLARSSPWLDIVGAVPGVDDQIGAVRDLTRASRQLGELGEEAAAALAAGLELADAGPAGRVALLDATIEQVDRVSSYLADVDYGADRFLVPPFSLVRDAFADELVESEGELADARASAVALREMLAGPSRYLVLAANNGEMTSGSGMTNSLGVATIENGDISIAEFVPADEVWLGHSAVRAPGDLDRLYGKMAIGVDFRGTTSSPNFPVIGNLYARMAARKNALGPVDGVFVVDPLLLRDIVNLTGPVEVGGQQYGADDVVEELLNRNYIRFPDYGARPERTKLQSDLAVAVFETLKTRSVGLAELAEALRDAATGRHLLAWSQDHDLQNLWRDLGAAGALRPDSFGIHLMNYAANKLDYYLAPTAVLALASHPDGSGDWRARLTVSLENAPRQETSDYIEGATTPGVHWVFLNVVLPKDVYDIRGVDQPFEGRGRDGPTKVVTMIYPVPLGETASVSLDFSIPSELDEMRLVPGGRLHPLELKLFGRTYHDDVPATIKLPQPPPLPPTGLDAHPALVLAALLALGAALLALAALRRLRRRDERTERVLAWAKLAGTLAVLAAALVVLDMFDTFDPFASR
jgi:hypothetical protein